MSCYVLRCIEGSPYEETQRKGPPHPRKAAKWLRKEKRRGQKEEVWGFWGPASWVGIPRSGDTIGLSFNMFRYKKNNFYVGKYNPWAAMPTQSNRGEYGHRKTSSEAHPAGRSAGPQAFGRPAGLSGSIVGVWGVEGGGGSCSGVRALGVVSGGGGHCHNPCAPPNIMNFVVPNIMKTADTLTNRFIM